MKAIHILFAFLPSLMPFALRANETCKTMGIYTYVIVQKLDSHAYDIVNYYDQSRHSILKTTKAVFDSPGMPIGIRVKDNHELMQVQMNSGFTKNVHVLEECGLDPLPAGYALQNVTFRNKVRGEK